MTIHTSARAPARSGSRFLHVSAISSAVAMALCHVAAAASDGANAPVRATASASVEKLVASLTLEEKIDLIGGTGFATLAMPRVGIPAFKMSDGPVGARSPAPSTAYAAGIGLAATWNTALAEEVGVQLGRDARSRGARFLLGPGVNVYRAPMNGRNFEYFGEDPFLGQRIAVGYVKGVQSQGVSATIKHYIGNNSEFARHTSDSSIDERTMREIYLPIFEAAVKEGKVGAVMSSYNLTNGLYTSEHPYLVKQVLKKEWAFNGLYMSDWGATHSAVAAANAGLDLEMPSGQFMNRATLLPAVKEGKVSAATIDDKVRRLLALAERFSWMSTPAPDLSIPRYNQAGRQAALQGARDGMVLLKNAGGLLPLDASKMKNIAVVGPNAFPATPTAGGSGKVPSFNAVSFLTGISDKLGSRVNVTYANGLSSLRMMTMLTAFSTAESGGKPGISVEAFDNPELKGTPAVTRVERQFQTGNPGFGGDPDFLQILDTLPPEQMQAVFASLMGGPRERRFERWTGWYTPTSAGDHTLFVQNTAPYRLFVDGKLVIDSSRVPAAAVSHVRLALDAKPHKVVFEQAPGSALEGSRFWRVGLVRDDAFVDPNVRALAAQADAVVVAVGFDADSETESADREFQLPPGQDRLIQEVAAANPNTIVVVTSGGSVDVAPWVDKVRALVAAWYPGQEGGNAFAEVLTGETNPSGRLPISWERKFEENPASANYYYNDPSANNRIVYKEGVFVGYRGYQKSAAKPQFPFGYGLSYTTFEYGNLKVSPAAAGSASAGTLKRLYTVSFDVKNTGSRKGADVAQIYVAPEKAKVPRPVRELKGFARVELAPGESRTVTVPLDARSFAYYDVGGKRWQADAGRYAVELGRSSEDIAAKADVSLPRALSVAVTE
jgi:beta-glucosidase